MDRMDDITGTAHTEDLERLAEARHWDPFSVLGPHVVSLRTGNAIAVRAILPDAARAFVLSEGGRKPPPEGSDEFKRK